MSDLLKKISNNLGTYYEATIEMLPSYLIAIGIVVLGIFLAFIFKLVVKKLVTRLEDLFHFSSSSRNNIKLREFYAVTISRIVFWCIIIYCIDYAANLIQLQILINFFDRIIAFIPNLIAAIALILGGFLFSNYIRKSIPSFINSIASIMLQIVLIIFFILLGIEQLGLNINLISNLIIVSVAAVLGCITLALGLGGKTITANIIGIQYAKKHLSLGDKLIINNEESEIIEITSSDIVVKSTHGVTILPGKMFQEKSTNLTQECRKNT